MRISSNMSMMLLDAGLSVPKPTRTPWRSRSGKRGDAAPGLGVALGAVRHRGTLVLEDADVVDARVHAVDGEEVVAEDTPLLQVLDGTHAERLDEHALPAHLLAEVVRELARAGADVGELVFALGDVAGDLEPVLARIGGDRLEEAAETVYGACGATPISTRAGARSRSECSRSSRSAMVSARRVSSMPKTSR